MGHDHHHHHHHEIKNIGVAFFLNLAFTLIEIVGGIFTNSLAIISDAVHDLGDCFSLGVSWYFQKVSGKKGDQKFSYGYRRFSLLGAIINAIVLITGSVLIVSEAVPRLLNPRSPMEEGMIVLAVLGIIFNGLAFLRIKKGHSINEKVVSLHMLEDLLGWVVVLIGSILMMFFNWPVIDPVMSVGIAAFVLYNAIRHLKKSFKILLQAVPENLEIENIRQKLLSLSSVKQVHGIHAWTLDGTFNILTVHLVLNNIHDIEEAYHIKKAVKETLKDESINHLTIEFEKENDYCELKDEASEHHQHAH